MFFAAIYAASILRRFESDRRHCLFFLFLHAYNNPTILVSVRPFKYISGIVPRCSFWFSYSFFKSGQSLVLMRPPQPPPYSIKFLLRKALFTTIAISGFIFRREIEENPSLQNSSSGCFDRSAATCRAPLLLLWQISCPLFYALIRDVIVTSQIKCRITSKW